jgi:VWFA-related protein
MRRWALPVLLAASGALAEDGPELGADPQPPFPSEARIVWIDVSAVDSGGRPLATLAGEDFTVAADARPRPLLAFRAPEPAGALVVLVEDVLLREPQLARARDAVRRVVAAGRPGDRVLLATASGLAAGLALPGDDAALLAGLERMRADPARLASLRQPEEIRSLHARRIDAVASALEALQGQEGARALVVIGPSLPHEVGAEPGRRARERLLRASQLAAAPFYFLRSGEDPFSAPVPGPGAGFADAAGGVARATPLLPAPRATLARSRELLYEAVAADSGGFITPGPSAWADAMDRIARLAQARYLLGIASTPDAWDGRYHAIEVRVARPGTRLHARRGYFAPLRAERPEP